MNDINTIDMVLSMQPDIILESGRTFTFQTNNQYWVDVFTLNMYNTDMPIYSDKYFNFNVAKMALRSNVFNFKNDRKQAIQFECDFILKSKKKHIIYAFASSSNDAKTPKFRVEIDNMYSMISVYVNDVVYNCDHDFAIDNLYNLIVTLNYDVGLVIQVNGEIVSNFNDYSVIDGYNSISTGSYYHYFGSDSYNTISTYLDGYLGGIKLSIGGNYNHRGSIDYTTNEYDRLLDIRFGNDIQSTNVSKYSSTIIYNGCEIADYTIGLIGSTITMPSTKYYVDFTVVNFENGGLLFDDVDFSINVSVFIGTDVPKGLVNEYTTSCLNFDVGLNDQIESTIWETTGAPLINSVNKIFGDGSFETKTLGDSLYTNSKVITGGATPFTIEFYALIKKSQNGSSLPPSYNPIFTKNHSNTSSGGDQALYVKDNVLMYSRGQDAGGLINSQYDNHGYKKVFFNELNHYHISYDGSAIRFFLNDQLDFILGTNNGYKVTNDQPYRFLSSTYPNDTRWNGTSIGLIDNINIFDGIATKVRDVDPYEDYLVVDLPFDGENNSTKILDNAKLYNYWFDSYIEFYIHAEHYWYHDLSKNLIGVNNNGLNSPQITTYNDKYVFDFNKRPPLFITLPKVYDDYTIEVVGSYRNIVGGERLFELGTSSGNRITILPSLSGYVGSVIIDGVVVYETNDYHGDNTLRHYVLMRKNGITYYFIDGVKKFEYSGLYTMQTNVWIGSDINQNGKLDGYIEMFRVTSKAIYDTNGFDKIDSFYVNSAWDLQRTGKITTDYNYKSYSSLYLYSPDGAYIRVLNRTKWFDSKKYTIYMEFYPTNSSSRMSCLINADTDTNTATNGRYIIINSNDSGGQIRGDISSLVTSNGVRLHGLNRLYIIVDGLSLTYVLNGVISRGELYSLDHADLSTNFRIGRNDRYNLSYEGYINCFKIYKDVAIYPESTVGKTQLDFDNNFNDFYGNSTWTNNGVTFDQVNSVSGYGANMVNIGTYIQTSNSIMNYEDKSFVLSFDAKTSRFVTASVILSSSSRYDVNGSTYLQIMDNNFSLSSNGGLGASASVPLVLNNFYNYKIKRVNKQLHLIVNDVVVGTTNIGNNLLNFNHGGLTILGACGWDKGGSYDASYWSGYLDNFKTYKEDYVKEFDVYSNSTQYSMSIIDEKLKVNTSSNNAVWFKNKDAILTKDCIIDVSFILRNEDFGVLFRTNNWSNVNDSYGYVVHIGNNYIMLGRGSNSSSSSGFTELITYNTSIEQNIQNTLKVKCDGDNIKVYFNDAQVIDFNDSTITTSGYTGFRPYGSNSVEICNYRISDLNGNELYYKDWKTKIENNITNTAVHLPLETNSTNIGYAPLTVNAVGSPIYSIVDGKKCIKFEAGKYLTISNNNIFNLGSNSDFYMEMDIYVNSLHSNGYGHTILNNGFGQGLYNGVGGMWLQYLPTTSGVNVGKIELVYFTSNSNAVSVKSDNAVQENSWNNLKIYRRYDRMVIVLNDIKTNVIFTNSFDFALGNGTHIGAIYGESTSASLDGYMSNFKMFVGTSQPPETYNQYKVLDLDFKPTRKSYLFKDNNDKCIIHPVNITQRDYQDSQYCCSFNGSNQYLQLGKNNLLNFGSDDFVIHIQIKLVEYSNKHNLIFGNNTNTYQNTTGYVYVSITPNNSTYPNRMRFCSVTNSGGWYVVESNVNINLNEITDVKIVGHNQIVKIFINDVDVSVQSTDSTVNTYDVINFNYLDNTYIGRNADNHYFNGYIYSVKVLRNTTDLSLLESSNEFVESRFDYEFVDKASDESRLISVNSEESNITIHKHDGMIDLNIDGEVINSEYVVDDGVDATIGVGQDFDGKFIDTFKIYSDIPTNHSYTIPDLDDSVIVFDDITTNKPVENYRIVCGGLDRIYGFVEGMPNKPFKLIDRYSNMVIYAGIDTYELSDVDINNLDNIDMVVDGDVIYPLPQYSMVRGHITYYLDANNACRGAVYKIKLLRRDDYRLIGVYDIVDGACTVSNLDCGVTYDAILFDVSNRYESITMSNRTPIED